MKIVIDGYNLLHQSQASSRDDLLHLLSKYQKNSGHKILVIFDGTYEGTFSGDRDFFDQVELVYTPITETADDYIGNLVGSLKGSDSVVVSSDRKVQSFARSASLNFIYASEFSKRLEWGESDSKKSSLEQDLHKPWHEGREEVDDHRPSSSTKKKGNPRRSSKKQRKRRKSLKKL
ncbi:MAG: NYN domain-containing protein [Bdellovibrionales bacterium]|nr:NYN domain-containing protein [Bdellovibrionales bacterium]